MPTKILHKRNNQQGAQPTTSSIDLGQLAINTYDGKLFLKKSGSNNDEIVQAVTTDSITQGSVYLSGSLTVSNSFESSGSATNIFTVYSKVIEFDANQIDLSGSLTITGSAIIPSLTGSLFGTSSWANTAISASYTPTLQQITDSGNTTTNDIIITGSLTVSGSSTLTNIGPAYFLDGNVGIGTTSPSAKFHLYDDYTTAGGPYETPFYVQLSRSSTGGSPAATYFTKDQYTLEGTDSYDNSLGKQLHAYIKSSGTTTNFRNLMSRVHTTNAGAASKIAHYATHLEAAGTGTIGSWYGMILGGVPNLTTFQNLNATITNTYGLYLGSLTDGTQTNDPYAIYQEGTEKIYLKGNVGIGTTSPNAKLTVGNSSYNGNLAVAESTNNNRVALIGNLEIVNNSTGGTWSGQSIHIPGANRTFGFVAGGALNAADSNAFAFKASINNNRTVDYTSFNFQGGYNTNTLAADYTFMKIDGNIFQEGINQSGSITGIDYSPNISQLTGSHTAMRLRSGDVLIEDGDLTVDGIITAREFHTEFVSSSIIYQSGSTKFGDTSDDAHQFTGSIQQLGSNSYFLGNVGIGTIFPSHPLDVSGSGRFTTSLTSSALVVSSSSTNVAKIIGSGSSAPLFEVIGSQGQLFSVVDSFSGSLFSINDISGLPLFDVDSNGDITVGDYYSPALIASGSVTTIPTQLTIGNVNITPLSQSLQTTQNYVTSSVAGLFYSKMDSVYYADGDPSDVDLLSGSTSTIYGSRNVPSSFFTGSGTYKSKVMSMRVVGSITFGNNKSLDTYIKIGNAVIPSTIYSTGNVDKTTAHPFELLADLIFNNGQVSVCSSVRYCDESYTYKAYPLSNLFETTSSIDLSGNIQLFVSASSTVAQMTASYSTIEFKN